MEEGQGRSRGQRKQEPLQLWTDSWTLESGAWGRDSVLGGEDRYLQVISVCRVSKDTAPQETNGEGCAVGRIMERKERGFLGLGL